MTYTFAPYYTVFNDVSGQQDYLGNYIPDTNPAYPNSIVGTMTFTSDVLMFNGAPAEGGTESVSSDGHTITLIGAIETNGDMGALAHEIVSAGFLIPKHFVGTTDFTAVYTDANGSVSATGTVVSAQANYATPVVDSISATADQASSSPLGVGSHLTITLATTGPVTVSSTGTLSLMLTDGGIATYDAAASTPTSLVFENTVKLGDLYHGLGVNSVSLGGATVTNINGGAVDLFGSGASTAFDPYYSHTGEPVSDFVVMGQRPQNPAFYVAGQEGSTGSIELNLPSTAPDSKFNDQEKLTLSGKGRSAGTVVISDVLQDGTTSILGTTTVSAATDVTGQGTWTTTLDHPLKTDGIQWLVATTYDAQGNPSDPTSVLVNIVPQLAVDGGTSQAGTFTADTGSHYAVVTGGNASFVANASATSSMTVYGNAGTVNFANGGGSGLVVGTGASAINMTGGLASSSILAFTGTGDTTYTGGAGTDEVISGGGNMTLTGGTGGSLLVFGGAGTLNLMGGAESDMIIGGAGAETIHAGLGAVFGGTGGSLMSANGAGTFLAGNVDGDKLSASSAGGDILVGGTGNETLNGANSAAGNIIFAGTGADLISLGLGGDTFAGGAGSDTIQAGSGNASIFLGTGGSSLLSFTAGSTGGTDTVSGFRVGTDHLSLGGYTGTATVSTAGGSSTLGLSDGTKIILNGVTTSTDTGLLG